MVQQSMMTEEEKQEWASTVSAPWQKENRALLSMLEEERRSLAVLQRVREQTERKADSLEHELAERQAALVKVHETLNQLRAPLHPTYGQLLLESGNRRVFAACPKRLTNKELFPTYHAQRAYRPERAELIAASVRKDDRFKGFPGMISMFELVGQAAAETRGNQVRGIVDGQHRIGAVEKLLSSGHWPEDRKVVIEVFSVEDPADAARLFMQINKMQPVLDVDMVPIQAAVAESLEQAADAEEVTRIKEETAIKAEIDACVAGFEVKYAALFKETPRCRPPHVHADSLRDALFKHTEARASAKKGAGELMRFIMRKNEEIKDLIATNDSREAAKARANSFYLGMSKAWLDQ
jgi:hypothetical protein